MNFGFALFLASGIGVVAGLRSMTAPAIVAWAAHLGWISLSGSHLAFMGSARAVGIFTLGALAEFVADQLPSTPARTTAGPLAARIVMGSLTGACLGTAGGALLWLGALIAAIGAIAGGFGGYQARVRLVQGLHVPDIAIAIPEDLIAIGLGLFLVFRSGNSLPRHRAQYLQIQSITKVESEKYVGNNIYKWISYKSSRLTVG